MQLLVCQRHGILGCPASSRRQPPCWLVPLILAWSDPTPANPSYIRVMHPNRPRLLSFLQAPASPGPLGASTRLTAPTVPLMDACLTPHWGLHTSARSLGAWASPTSEWQWTGLTAAFVSLISLATGLRGLYGNRWGSVWLKSCTCALMCVLVSPCANTLCHARFATVVIAAMAVLALSSPPHSPHRLAPCLLFQGDGCPVGRPHAGPLPQRQERVRG